MSTSLEALLTAMLLYGIFPLWLAACGADWIFHRRSRIETTSGLAESRLHLLLYFQIALPVALVVLFEPNALVLTLLCLGALAHLVCSVWDTSVSQPRRYIAPLEQHVHSFLDMLPLFGAAILVCLHWDAFRVPEWQFYPRHVPLPLMLTVYVLGGLTLGLLALLEEFIRCALARARVPA